MEENNNNLNTEGQEAEFPEVIFEEVKSSYDNLTAEAKAMRILANEYLDIVEKSEEKQGLGAIYWGLGCLIAGFAASTFIPLENDKTIVAFLGFTLVIGSILSTVFAKFIKF